MIQEKNIQKDEGKQECIKRMQLLKLDEQIIHEFAENDIIYISRLGQDIQKIDDEISTMIKEFETNMPVKIFHIIHIQKTDNIYFLFIYTNKRDEWKLEKRDARLGFSYAIYNHKKALIVKEIGILVDEGKICKVVG